MTFGLALEPFPVAALALAALVLASPRVRRLLYESRLDRFVLVASAAAALISAAYVIAYLRGGPRIIDATSYYLEGRALAGGKLSWTAGDPSEVGRFLVRDAGGTQVAVIFPPGYPAVLAVGFWLGAPMAIGPIIAFGATFATGALARAALPAAGAATDRVTRAAVLLSVACGALRYQTADTMSHGLAALCVAGGLAFALRLRASGGARDALGAGAALGLLVAARPISGGGLLLVMALVVGLRVRARTVAIACLAALPFVALLVLHQRAAAGAFFESSQALYYANSDGPPGCFRYGFGQGVGCLHEHGDFVRDNLSSGYGPLAAAGTTLRRLKMHGVDALNAEPLALLLLVPALVTALRHPGLRAIGALPLVLVAAYGPFYFDGNYPGGGARFLADGLPVEHVLVAWFSGCVVAPRLEQRWPRRAWSAWPHWLLAASLLAFALRAANDHRALRDREGGRPMFEPGVLSSAGVEAGLLFVDTDHGFSLAFDPAPGPLRVARYRGDHFDWLTWQAAGRPAAFRYDYEIADGSARVSPFTPEPMPFLEGANLWPPLWQQGGSALPAYGASACAGHERVLNVIGEPSQPTVIDLALPSGLAGVAIAPVVARSQAGASIELRRGNALLASWQGEALAPGCHATSPFLVPTSETVQRAGQGVDPAAFTLRVTLPAAAENHGLELAAIAVAVDKSNRADGW